MGFIIQAGVMHGKEHSIYIIRLIYLVLTLCIEVPLVYFLLNNRSKNKKILLLIIIAVNVITTIIVAVLERRLCQGRW